MPLSAAVVPSAAICAPGEGARPCQGAGAGVGRVPCGRMCYPREDTPGGREAAYRASFDLGARWAFNFNIIMDSVALRRYDDSAPAAVKKFAATIPDSDWEAMEKPDFIGINLYNGQEGKNSRGS